MLAAPPEQHKRNPHSVGTSWDPVAVLKMCARRMRLAGDGKEGRGAYPTDRFHVLCIRKYDNLLGVQFQSCLYIVVDQRHVSDGEQGLQVSRY